MRMIADTNVLLRFVLDDDPEQYQLALDTHGKVGSCGGDQPRPL